MKKKILLAYSGGLDTSAIIPWLMEEYDAEVIAYCSDLGNAPDKDFLEKRAYDLGASKFIFEDVKERFVSDFVFPMLRSGALYQDEYLLGTAIARPLIAERIAHWAKELGAYGIAHGATGKGNDQLRFERAWAYLVPDVKVIAPWKIWSFSGRSDLQTYLNKKGFDISSEEKEYSVDVNLLHRSCEGGILEDIKAPFDTEKVYQWTKQPGTVPSLGTSLTLSFSSGVPVAINGKAMKSDELLTNLNEVGGQHGIGVVDIVEERTNGIKSRGIYETPGGTILQKAYRCLKQVAWSRSTHQVASQMALQYANFIYDGLWHADVRSYIDGFFDEASKCLTGDIKIKLVGEQMIVEGRDVKKSLYDGDLVSFETDPMEINKSAGGFCKTMSYSQWQAGRVSQ